MIFDRDGHPLVDSRPIYNVILSREDLKGRKLISLAKPLSEALGVDGDILRDRFEQISSQPAFESILVKQDASPGDIAWVEAHELEFPELRVEQQPQRRYPPNGLLAHVLGYVGEISPEQLKQASTKTKDSSRATSSDKADSNKLTTITFAARTAIEKLSWIVADAFRMRLKLCRRNPVRIWLPPSISICRWPPRNNCGLGDRTRRDRRHGSKQRRNACACLGANLRSKSLFQRIGTKEGRAEYAALLNDPEKPLINRAVQSRYPPGSTWKIPMADRRFAAGRDHARTFKPRLRRRHHGRQQVYALHGKSRHARLKSAITHSCDGYFYRLGLKMGLDGIVAMVDEFDLNKRTGIDLPNEVVDLTPSREFKKRTQPRKS